MSASRWAGLSLVGVSIFVSLVIFFPIFYTFMAAFMTIGEFSAYPRPLLPASFLNFDNFVHVFTHAPMSRYMLNSFIVSAVGSAVRLLLSVLAAYAIVFYDFRGKNLVFFLVLGTMMLPGDTLVLANFLAISSMGLMDTYLGLMIVYFVSAIGLFMLRQVFKSSPRELRDASRIDGCGDFGYIWHVLLPTSKPILYTLYVQSFVSLWNLYLWPLLITNRTEMRTVQIGLTMLTTVDGTNYDVVMAGIASILIPSFVIFVLLRRSILRGMVARIN